MGLYFIGTNPHNVQDGRIVGHHHVKARSGWRKNGRFVVDPGGMEHGYTRPGGRIAEIEPYNNPEQFWLQLRNGRGQKGWVPVDYPTYQKRKGTYVDLRPSPIVRTRLSCTIGPLSASLNITDEEQDLWRRLSRRLKAELELRPGEHDLRIKGFHLRSRCRNPYLYWGTIILGVEFTDSYEHGTGFVADFDCARSGNRIMVRHQLTTFETSEDQVITRVVQLIITELGILQAGRSSGRPFNS